MSCAEEAMEPDMGYDFFPLQEGFTKTYEVEEILITGSVPDTLRYFLKERIGDTIQVADGQPTYTLERYKSADTTVEWNLDSVWSIRKTEYQGVIAENNIPYVKLTFPVKAGNEWDGNALNIINKQTYRYQSIESYTLNDDVYSASNVIRVVISDIPENLINQDQRSEVYIRGIGLVEKNYFSVEFCQPGDECGSEISDGRILNQVLIAYGTEE